MKNMDRPVNERDFRMPEYRDADPKDYEFDGDGIPVRKDRWEMAVRRIAGLIGSGRRAFVVDEIVDAVEQMAVNEGRWLEISLLENEANAIEPGYQVNLKLENGTVLKDVYWQREDGKYLFTWRGVDVLEDTRFWQETNKPNKAAHD